MAGAPALTLLLLLLLPAHQAGYAGAEADTCGPALGGAAGARPGTPADAPGATVGPIVRLKESMENGSDYNLSELRMHCHMGTHVDAPGHMNQAHSAAGLDVDTLDLQVLNVYPLMVNMEESKSPGHQWLNPSDGASMQFERGINESQIELRGLI
uniref:Kynurenine formamidase n=1 Tax=Aegilops tauschii TaxID=37682 RepID=M8BLW5_AEGTA